MTAATTGSLVGIPWPTTGASTYDDRLITRFYSLLFIVNWKRHCSLERSLFSQPYSGFFKALSFSVFCCLAFICLSSSHLNTHILLQPDTSVQVHYQLTVQQLEEPNETYRPLTMLTFTPIIWRRKRRREWDKIKTHSLPGLGCCLKPAKQLLK